MEKEYAYSCNILPILPRMDVTEPGGGGGLVILRKLGLSLRRTNTYSHMSLSVEIRNDRGSRAVGVWNRGSGSICDQGT